MLVSISQIGTQFHLKTNRTSYIFGVRDRKRLLHLYWGNALPDDVDLTYLPNETIYPRANAFHVPGNEESSIFLTDFQFEFATVGGGDYRTPTLEIICPDSSPVVDFEYVGYKVFEGRNELCGLPHVYCEDNDQVDTLQIELMDHYIGLRAYLTYTVFEEYDVITRSIRYENMGTDAISLTSAQSMCVDMPGQDYRILQLHGDWARECNVDIQRVSHGSVVLDSKRGMSSHSQNPFVALLRGDANEDIGEVYGFSFVYSGNFIADVNADSNGGTRVTVGIHNINFSWKLNVDESFQTPEVVMVYSNNGLGGMSNIYHKLYRERLCRGKWRDTIRPIVINNWEGTTFSFDEEVILDIAQKGSEVGAEIFVLDDGWFGKRDNERSSLGDWQVYRKKLPHGLGYLADKINQFGLKFGLWFEPEMISPDSDLYREHPDWCLHAEGRQRTENRWQLILDLSKEPVREYIIDAVSSVLSSANIEYVKWDCNRNITELANTEQSHRYVMGLYDILERLTTKFPNVLFEGCSGGGGRFDPGMLYYMPQVWTSDETFPVSRMSIQTGTSIVYPAISMTAHIASAVTDMPKGFRGDILNTAAYVSMAANFGLEMDLRKLSETEIEQVKQYLAQYKEIRMTVQFGDMYRLETGEGGFYSFEFVDDNQMILFTYQTKTGMNGRKRRVYPKELDGQSKYLYDSRIYYGCELMRVGVNVSLERYEYASKLFVFKKT